MKFIRNLVSRQPQPESAQEPEGIDHVTAFEDVIGYGEDTVEDLDAYEEELLDVEGPLVLENPEPKEEVAPDEAAEPEAPEKDTAFHARNAYADSAFEESRDILDKLALHLQDEPVPASTPSQVRIWDIEDEIDDEDMPTSLADLPDITFPALAPETAAGPMDLSVTAPQSAVAGRSMFPVGWMVIESGPGRGTSFPLEAGLSLIGRDADQAIQLDFGDTSVAQSNHAAVVYDPETHGFTLGHGGKKDIVRLNGKPVISNEVLSMGDRIRIGDTTLHFIPLCSDSFDWAAEDQMEQHEQVAVA